MDSRFGIAGLLGFLVVICDVAAPVAAPQAGAALSPPAIERIDTLTRSEFAKDQRGGATVGIVSRADLVWTNSYGYSDVERRLAADAQTVYRIGSITKTFTALALLQLAETGTVRVTDPVEKYFPEVKRAKGRAPDSPPITLIQLATMTSGLAREPDDLDRFVVGPVGKWEDVLITALSHTRYAFPSDTRYLYSNVGYAILGAAIARAAHKPFTEYVTERIFSPLGMTHTAFEPTTLIQAHLAKGYDVLSDGQVDAETPQREHRGRGYKVPNGALYTTVRDLGRYVSLMLGYGPDGVIKRITIDDNFSRVNSANGDLSFGYGLGFQVERHGELLVYGHNGTVAGYNAAMCYNRPLGLGVIVLRNVGGGEFSVTRLCQAALAVLAAGS